MPRKPAVRKKPTALWPYHHWVMRILDAAEQGITFYAEEAYRHSQVVYDVQQRDGYDEREVIPVGDVDVRLLPLEDGAQEDDEIE